MKRRGFIRLAGLTTFGFMAGGNLFASVLKMSNSKLIEISPPNIHVRHGFFNLQVTHKNGLHVQRDIFNQTGLETVSNDRMISLKITDENIETFGIKDKLGFNSKSNRITAISLEANKITSINIDSSSLLFSEYDELTVEGTLVKTDKAFIQPSKTTLAVLSKSNQSIFIYKREV